jgi:hypothetical protein
MTTSTHMVNRKPGALAGVSILVMAVLAGVVMSSAFSSLLGAKEGASALEITRANEHLLPWVILAWIAILLCDVVAAWGLHMHYGAKAPARSLITAWLRVVYAGLLGTAIAGLVIAWQSDVLGIDAAVYVLLGAQTFGAMWSLGLIVFGFHLIGLSKLVCDQGWFPKLVAGLLLVAGWGYVIMNVLKMVWPAYESVQGYFDAVFVLPMVLGEVILAIWLIVLAFRKKQ